MTRITPERLAELRRSNEIMGVLYENEVDELLDALESSYAELDALKSQLEEQRDVVPEPCDIDAAWNNYVALNSAMLSEDPDDDLEVFSAGFRAGAGWGSTLLPAMREIWRLKQETGYDSQPTTEKRG